MFATAALTLLASSLLARVAADPVPSEPAPLEVFNAGSKCHISWEADTTNTWKTMYIELMTGANLDMVHLTTVGMVDGTDASNVTLDWTCPEVTLNAPVYFYQFSSPQALHANWTGTGRFTIASSSGQTTSAPNTTDGINWGTGALVDASSATPPPDLTGGASSASGSGLGAGSASASGSASPSASGITVTSAGAGSVTVTQVSSTGSPTGAGSPSAPATSTGANDSGAMAVASPRGVAALALGAAVFAAFL